MEWEWAGCQGVLMCHVTCKLSFLHVQWCTLGVLSAVCSSAAPSTYIFLPSFPVNPSLFMSLYDVRAIYGQKGFFGSATICGWLIKRKILITNYQNLLNWIFLDEIQIWLTWQLRMPCSALVLTHIKSLTEGTDSYHANIQVNSDYNFFSGSIREEGYRTPEFKSKRLHWNCCALFNSQYVQNY